MHRIFRRWLTGAHHAIDSNTGGKLVRCFIHTQRLGDVSTLIQLVGIDTRQFLNTSLTQFFQQGIGQLFIGFGNNLACITINDIASHHATDQEIFGDAQMRRTRLLQVADMAGIDTFVFGNHHGSIAIHQIKTCDFTAQALRNKFHQRTAVHQTEAVVHEELRQNRLIGHPDGFQQR